MRAAQCQVCKRMVTRDAWGRKDLASSRGPTTTFAKGIVEGPIKRGDKEVCGTLPFCRRLCRFANQNFAPLGKPADGHQAMTDCSSLSELTALSRKYSRAPAQRSYLPSRYYHGGRQTGRLIGERHDATCASALVSVMRGKSKASRRAAVK